MIRTLFRPKAAARLTVALVGFTLATLLLFNAIPKGKRVTEVVVLDYGVSDPAFARDIATHLSAPLISGNRSEPFVMGQYG